MTKIWILNSKQKTLGNSPLPNLELPSGLGVWCLFRHRHPERCLDGAALWPGWPRSSSFALDRDVLDCGMFGAMLVSARSRRMPRFLSFVRQGGGCLSIMACLTSPKKDIKLAMCLLVLEQTMVYIFIYIFH